MKILVLLGGGLVGEIAIQFKKLMPQLLQFGHDGNNKKATPFLEHAIFVVNPEEAIDAFLEHSPEKLIFAGTHYDKEERPLSLLVTKILIQSMGGDSKRFLYTNLISVPPFHKEPNFFTMTDTDGMAKWFELL